MILNTKPDGVISIHALREEGDATVPARDAPPRISIHALREEGDHPTRPYVPAGTHFYPRPPRGGRRQQGHLLLKSPAISIHALREEGDPSARPGRPGPYEISIHALREEGDLLATALGTPTGKFLSTPSARRATKNCGRQSARGNISIHALREEGDVSSPCRRPVPRYFYPRPPRGGRRQSRRPGR